VSDDDDAGSGDVSGRPRPNPARRNEATRQSILDAALELVVANGFAALSVESIAKRAGVGKQTIYRWWPSKGAVLLDAFLENRVEELSEVSVLDPFDSGNFTADVHRLVRDIVRAFALPAWEAPYRALTVAIQDDPVLATLLSERIIRPSLAEVRSWLATAQERGDIRQDIDLHVGVEILLAPVFHRWLLRTGPLTDEYAQAVADAAIAALERRHSAA
jgi:AcrR family transcriptional regulator